MSEQGMFDKMKKMNEENKYNSTASNNPKPKREPDQSSKEREKISQGGPILTALLVGVCTALSGRFGIIFWFLFAALGYMVAYAIAEVIQAKKNEAESKHPAPRMNFTKKSNPQSLWYYKYNGQEFGPVEKKAIYDMVASGGLPDNITVREENTATWKFYHSSGIAESFQNAS